VRVLFVCLGNICRSPTAEGVMRHLLRERGLEDRVEVASAGTGGWHVGSPPDERSAAAARARGITLDGAAQQVRPEDFARHDLLVAMDRSNLADLLAIAPDEHARGKVRLLLDDADVPDPYYGGPSGFDDVLDLVTEACERLADEVAGAPPLDSGGRSGV
jgi:protein-tyrosine phosphatase